MDVDPLALKDIFQSQSLPLSGWGKASRSSFDLMPATQQETTADLLEIPLSVPAVDLLGTIDAGNHAARLYQPSVPEIVPAAGFRSDLGGQGVFEVSSISKEALHCPLPSARSSAAMVDFGRPVDKSLADVALRRQTKATASCRPGFVSIYPMEDYIKAEEELISQVTGYETH